jgi:hypothetical protein
MHDCARPSASARLIALSSACRADRFLALCREETDVRVAGAALARHGLSGEDVRVLVQAGVLALDITDTAQYMFCVPQAASVRHHLVLGRREIYVLLRRQRYLQLPETDLLRRSLRRSSLPMYFLLRDMCGGGEVQRDATSPFGPLIKLAETGAPVGAPSAAPTSIL